MQKQVINIYTAKPAHIEGLLTWRALPVGELAAIDPFIFLNHHGPEMFPPGNNGLPFGPHPHRGFETVTFIINGDVMHTDSSGGQSVIKAGGVQWMTAGSGLIHAEVSSEEFKNSGGNEEILQLWVNLPAKNKMVPPAYYGFQKDELPLYILQEGNVSAQVIAGSLEGVKGPIQSFSGLSLSLITFNAGTVFNTAVAKGMNILCYVVSGKLHINGNEAITRNLVRFSDEGENITFEASERSIVIFGFAEPLNEPVVAYGPFVMNTEKEIQEAIRDYQNGKMGVWKEDHDR